MPSKFVSGFPAVRPHSCRRSWGGVFLALAWLALSAAQAQTTNFALGTTSLLVSPAAGSNSVVLAAASQVSAWTATTNAAWLRLSPAFQSGTGSANVVFNYDANPGPTRSGALTIAGQTLTITQAGSTYVAAGALAPLLSAGDGVAVNGADNVFCIRSNSIEEWMAATGKVTTLVSSGLALPMDLALDGSGNIYIADSGNNAIKEWIAPDTNVVILTNKVTALVSSGLDHPAGVAVDAAGKVYIADTDDNAIKKWTPASKNLATLVSGLGLPSGVAVDRAGNVYFSDTGTNAVMEWTVANGNVITLVSSGLNYPESVKVDGSGNVFIADAGNAMVKEWTACSGTVATLVSSGLVLPARLALDGAGNIYIDDNDADTIYELPHALVDPTPRAESDAAGSDALPVVLPATANLLGPFAPASSAPAWLTITGVSNGVVSFSFTANTGPARTANITLLGQTIPVTQGLIGTPPALASLQMLGNGVLQFSFTNTPGAVFTVLSTTNLSLPMSEWTVVGVPTNTTSNVFQFTSQPTTNNSQCFYGVRSP